MRDDLEGFTQLYETDPPAKLESEDVRREVEAMFAELSRLEGKQGSIRIAVIRTPKGHQEKRASISL
jgi:hypothetical protein